MRDPVRARPAAVHSLRRARQQLPGFLLRHGWTHAGKNHAIAQGFPAERTVVISNGIDVTRFQPDPAAGARIRRDWGIGGAEKVVGLIGRLDPIKDHPTFFRAAAEVASEYADLRFVCAGGGPAAYQQKLALLSQELGIAGRIIWTGECKDMPAVYNALDIVACASVSEGFPNVLGEAMACGVPCVVTDVGDAGEIVGETGIVVPPRNPEAMARGVSRLLERNNAACCLVRERIIERFSSERMVEATAIKLQGLVR